MQSRETYNNREAHMNKAKLAAVVADKTGLTKKDSEAYLNTVIDTIMETLAAGEKVQIVGFGAFNTRMRKPYTGHDPHTGAPVDIPSDRAVSFKPGKALKEAVLIKK